MPRAPRPAPRAPRPAPRAALPLVTSAIRFSVGTPHRMQFAWETLCGQWREKYGDAVCEETSVRALVYLIAIGVSKLRVRPPAHTLHAASAQPPTPPRLRS